MKLNNLIATKAEKGNTLMIMHKDEYDQKIDEFMATNDFTKLSKDQLLYFLFSTCSTFGYPFLKLSSFLIFFMFQKELYNSIANITVWQVLRKRLHLEAHKLPITTRPTVTFGIP
jgi:hypothetical protein